jgi:hypothetical protein
MNILQGLRAVASASGFKRGDFIGDTKLSLTIIRCHHRHRVAHEKIGPPYINGTVFILTIGLLGPVMPTSIGDR